MDQEISRWILEFLVRQHVDDRILDILLSTLRLQDDDPQLRKALLLRKIGSQLTNGAVSEKILDLLELVDELDFREGKVASETMRAAYCAVAVDCTVSFLEEEMESNGKYFDTLERIWRGKIQKMQSSENSGLISEELRSWRDDLQSASKDVELRGRILLRNTRNEALKAVKSYLAEAWNDMGPSFLEKTAEDVAKMGKVGQEMKDVAVSEIVEHAAIRQHSMLASNEPGIDRSGSRTTASGLHHVSVNETGSRQVFEGVENTVVPHDGKISSGGPAVDGEDIQIKARNTNDIFLEEPSQRAEQVSKAGGTQNKESLFKHQHAGLRSGCSRKAFHGRFTEVRITNIEEVDEDMCTNKYRFFPSPEVDKIRAALKSSFVDLHAVVRDPLPEALQIAENVVSDMQRDSSVGGGHGDEAEQTILRANGVEKIGRGDGHLEREDHGNQSQLSLVVFNPSLTNDSDELSGGLLNRPYLPSPKVMKISPLRKYEMTKPVRRRQRKKWSPLEENTLRKGVEEFGKGNWKVILNTYCNIFEERTEVDLKDKWRNMTRNIG